MTSVVDVNVYLIKLNQKIFVGATTNFHGLKCICDQKNTMFTDDIGQKNQSLKKYLFRTDFDEIRIFVFT